jgi:XTP/dITP diphosphohydrolase
MPPSPNEAPATPPPGDAGPTTDGAAAALAELLAVVDRLRDPEQGCPWDLEQTHSSLIPYVLEEAHEVADAIRHGNHDHLAEELGDLLLQVVLHARIASESGHFDFVAVARGISAKLVRRHPHVFGTAEARDSAAVRLHWEAIKLREQAERDHSRAATAPAANPASGAEPLQADLDADSPKASAGPSPLSDRLAGKVRGMPALAGAMTISRKAAAAGFEWDAIDGVWAKVEEELGELREALASGDRGHAQEELGDVLFTLVNVGRWGGLDPEEGLAGTNRRFLDRFRRVEAALGGDLGGRSIGELESHWRAAKAAIRAENGATPATPEPGGPAAAPAPLSPPPA